MSADRCPRCDRPVNLTGTYDPESECGEHEGSLTCRLFTRALTAERETERLRHGTAIVRAVAESWAPRDSDDMSTDLKKGIALGRIRCRDELLDKIDAALAQGADR